MASHLPPLPLFPLVPIRGLLILGFAFTFAVFALFRAVSFSFACTHSVELGWTDEQLFSLPNRLRSRGSDLQMARGTTQTPSQLEGPSLHQRR